MTILDCIALFFLLSAMAALPSISVMLVVSRTLSGGVSQGVMVCLGIVAADLLYLLLAMFGLTIVAMWLEQHRWLLQIMAIIILVLFSYQLWHSPYRYAAMATSGKKTSLASFMAGFTLTLVDYKAIFFYLGILPVYLGSSDITLSSLLMLLSTTAIAVAWVKLAYVLLANHVQGAVVLQKSYRFMSVILCLIALWLTVDMVLSQFN